MSILPAEGLIQVYSFIDRYRIRRSEVRVKIDGASVLITGAASGIGKATALAFAARCPEAIIACDIDEAGLLQTVRELRALGCHALGVRMDVTDPASVKAAIGAAIQECGRLDILMNSAGIGMMGRMECLTDEDWRRIVDINLWGTINTNRAAFDHMLARGSGHIVNVASVNGIYAPVPYIAPYATTKFAVVGLSESLMVEGRARGIMVTCVCPGNVRTPIYQNSPLVGFTEGARSFTAMNRLIAESPEKTAAQIVKAVERDRFLVITTPFARLCAFARTHFQGAWFAYTRAFAVLTERALRRYRQD